MHVRNVNLKNQFKNIYIFTRSQCSVPGKPELKIFEATMEDIFLFVKCIREKIKTAWIYYFSPKDTSAYLNIQP